MQSQQRPQLTMPELGGWDGLSALSSAGARELGLYVSAMTRYWV